MEYRQVAQDKLLSAYETIKGILCNMFEIFRNDGREVYHYWVKYVERIDKGVEEALQTTVSD